MKMFFNGVEQNVYKAALHIHSTTSDGRFTPEQVIDIYSKAGFDVLAFTDHRKTNAVSTFDGKGMTLLSGIEVHPFGPRNLQWHILGLGVPENFADGYPETGQAAVDAIVNSGGAAFVAHPCWCGFTSAEAASLQGISGIEVYNTSTRYIGKDFNMVCWDEMLDAGFRVTALAVDDMHQERDMFRGWTMIIAQDKSPESVLNAVKQGSFYATQGPQFTEISFENGVISADFTPCTSAICCMRRNWGKCAMVENFSGPESGKQEVTHLEFDLSDCSDQYVRIQLQDADGRMAWSNPYYIS